MMGIYIDRFKNLKTRKFEVEVITPLFLGGAEPGKAELRTPSIKALLRFWWRALYGSEDIADMKRRESQIFGSTDNISSFSLYIENDQDMRPVLKDLPSGPKVMTESKGKKFSISIIDYLSYGLNEYNKTQKKNVYTRQHFPSGSKFTLSFKMKENEETNQVIDALRALAVYGGLGARSRNGLGSIKVKELTDGFKFDGNLKPFTSISSRAILFDGFEEQDKWENALAKVGEVYRKARLSLESRHRFDKRQFIAKPIIVKGEVDINDRHSKPYFLRVNKLDNGKFKGQILFLPYLYDGTARVRTTYENVCNEMNAKIRELTGGTK